ncbi:MAG TPA: L,D-transpeptidase [Thermoanaerobaculia bacterium]|nr:L,D-transpeptidase [Thermoanaerobaculia bacterium]
MRNLVMGVLLATFLSFPAAADDVVNVVNEMTIEGLPTIAPRQGPVITIDVSTNQAYLFQDGELVKKSAAATGSDKVLRHRGSIWWFRTPRGRHKVLRKIADPVWRKPDWAFVEEGKRVPPPDSPRRMVKGKLGKYALDLGEGILIHGTDDPKSIGRKASHGCIRLPNEMLEALWKSATVGTDVLIFESTPELAATKGMNDLEMGGQ